jgi:hypothetical protein
LKTTSVEMLFFPVPAFSHTCELFRRVAADVEVVERAVRAANHPDVRFPGSRP